MKRILKVSNWDTTTAFTSQNVLDESHWMVAGLKRALTLLDIGNFAINYSSGTRITIQTGSYGSFAINRPTNTQNGPYLFYVNSEEKELWGGSCLTQTYDISTNRDMNSSNQFCNFIRGAVCYSTGSATSTYPNRIVGGILQLKFENGRIKGFSGDNLFKCGWNLYTPVQIGLVLPENYISYANPLTAVSLKYTKQPIVSGTASGIINFEGEYFRSIYICDKYYSGGLKSADNTKFIFDGYLFIVDDARDIEVIETTV